MFQDNSVLKKQNIPEIVEKNFFFIDSQNMGEAETHLYGYCIADEMAGGGYSLGEIEFSREYSNGAYVLVQNLDEKLYISHDYNGAGAIYIFRKEEYFALSNSLLLMAERLSDTYALTVNYDYANAFLASDLASVAYCETLVNEIELLPRNVSIVADKKTRKLEIVAIDYEEHSVEVATSEGLAVLDKWYYKWVYIIRNLKNKTNNIICDLSGGFDSRLVFGLMAYAGIDLDSVCFRSIHDGLHTHKEDFAIASAIAKRFEVCLNTESLSNKYTNLELGECINASFYTKVDVHKQMHWQTKYCQNPLFHFSGGGGECLRTFWHMSPELYIQTQYDRGMRYHNTEMAKSMSRITKNACKKTEDKFPLAKGCDLELMQLLYRETRCRYHSGRNARELYCSNEIKLYPLMDSVIGKLCSRTSDDANFLIAVIYTRYFPELLDFPFEGGRMIKDDVIMQAKELNAIFPFQPFKASEKSKKEMVCVGNNAVAGNHEREVNSSEADKLILDVFLSKRVQKMIEEYFGEDVYEFANCYRENCKYYSLQEIYPIVGIYIVQDILSNRKQYSSVYERLRDVVASEML